METMGIKLAAVLSVIPPTEEGELIYLTRLTDIWHYFYTTTLILMEAVFLPINHSIKCRYTINGSCTF